MTSFAKASFDVAGYLACRPTYPPRLWDVVTRYHALNGGRFDRLLDVGCGPGFVALALSSQFKSVTAIDPAKKMVDIGLQPSNASLPRIKYSVGSAEDLAAVGVGEGDNGADLIIAGQAAHWFDYPKVWREFTKHLRPGGTVAFIGYAEMMFPNNPKLNRLIAHHSRAPDAPGSYWQPGRRIVEAYLHPVPFPVTPAPDPNILSQLPPLDKANRHPIAATISEPTLSEPESGPDGFDFSSWDPRTAVRLHDDAPAESSGSDSAPVPWLMRRTFDKRQLEGYLRTFSALHSYHEAHPEDAERRGRGAEGDIVDRFVHQVWMELEKESPGEAEPETVDAGWPLILMMIKKKP